MVALDFTVVVLVRKAIPKLYTIPTIRGSSNTLDMKSPYDGGGAIRLIKFFIAVCGIAFYQIVSCQ